MPTELSWLASECRYEGKTVEEKVKIEQGKKGCQVLRRKLERKGTSHETPVGRHHSLLNVLRQIRSLV